MKLTAQELKEVLPNASGDFMELNVQQGFTPKATASPTATLVKRDKYNRATPADRTYNGITYGSKKEMLHAQELDLRVQAGEIDFWIRQVPFIIGNDPVTKYVADFMTFRQIIIYESDQRYWDIEVHEVKPKSEKAWAPGAKRKIKLFRAKYPNLPLRIV